MLSTSAHVIWIATIAIFRQRANQRTDQLVARHAGRFKSTNWIGLVLPSFLGFDADAYVDVEELPNEAQRYARSFQRGEITHNELRARAERMQTSQLDGLLTS